MQFAYGNFEYNGRFCHQHLKAVTILVADIDMAHTLILFTKANYLISTRLLIWPLGEVMIGFSIVALFNELDLVVNKNKINKVYKVRTHKSLANLTVNALF